MLDKVKPMLEAVRCAAEQLRGKGWGLHEVETRDLGPGKTKKPQTPNNKHVYRVDQKYFPTFLRLAYK